jgi:hypothetical protein
LVERAGFPAGFISGGGLSETLLGYSDVGLMGFELNLAAITRLAACCTIPLLADADTGYGNAVNVYHTTRAFEQAGMAGLMIEDQTWPKRCGHIQGKEVIPAEEMVEKIHAACDARRDPAFVIKARTDAFACQGGARGEDLLGEICRRVGELGALLVADRRRGCCRSPTPDQHDTILVNRELFGLDDFGLQVFEVLLVQIDASPDSPVRYPPVVPEQFKHLGQDLVERHARPSADAKQRTSTPSPTSPSHLQQPFGITAQDLALVLC